jgi:hypothetical protein
MSHGDSEGNGMNHTLRTVILGVLVLATVGPAVIDVVNALVPLVLVVGVVAAALRMLWFYTGRW